MPYTFTCDVCGRDVDRAPPFMGEFRESFLKTSDSFITELYSPGDTVTVCLACMEDNIA